MVLAKRFRKATPKSQANDDSNATVTSGIVAVTPVTGGGGDVAAASAKKKESDDDTSDSEIEAMSRGIAAHDSDAEV